MTTTVTLETHDWPVEVSTHSAHSFADDQRTSYSNSSSCEFVGANTKRTFAISDTGSITFRELPVGATGLGIATQALGMNASAALGSKAA